MFQASGDDGGLSKLWPFCFSTISKTDVANPWNPDGPRGTDAGAVTSSVGIACSMTVVGIASPLTVYLVSLIFAFSQVS